MIQYDPHHWGSHLFDIRGSMVREIIWRVASCVAWAGFVVYVHGAWFPKFEVPTTVHTLTGVALSLLLVFRTNASYDRFWEGRKMWGSIINESRNLGRSASVVLRSSPRHLESVVYWTIAFCYSAMHELRGKEGLGPIAEKLPPKEVQSAIAAHQTPLAVARRITYHLESARASGVISDVVFASLDANVQQLIDYIGGCQRIHRTPLPFAYVVHLRRALILYCFSLPIALVKDFGYWTVLWTLFVTYVFAGIEEIGVEIEDPFGEDENDLPVDGFCHTIESNLLELLGEPVEAPLPSEAE